MSTYKSKRLPRSARRSRKPLQENWIRGPGSGSMIKCTYVKCSYEWKYFGRRKWAQCPACHSVVRVALAKKNLVYHQRATNSNEFKNE
jgi:hypothetical protein